MELRPFDYIRILWGVILLGLVFWVAVIPNFFLMLIVVVVGLLFWPIHIAIEAIKKRRNNSN